jgi:hypothetical protein
MNTASQGMNMDKTKFYVRDENGIVDKLKQLHNSESPVNWILFSYEKNDLILSEFGTGGLPELQSKLIENQIQYAAIELQVKGDEYNPIKFVLLTWIGPKVSAGLEKARASAHRDQILELVNKGIPVSAQHQAEHLEEVSYEQLAQAVSRYRPAYGTASNDTQSRQEMSRSASKKQQLSTFKITDQSACEAGLKAVTEGKADWVILAYTLGKKDEIEMVTTGKGGIDGLKQHFPKDRIYYALMSMNFKTIVGNQLKTILVTMIGPDVPPLQKARSSAQRKEISDFVLSVVPLNFNYQPNDASEMLESVIAKMFQD